ncbi:lactonase family protein [Agromyces atrinae]|uniref:6-phosphogluconolactonase n=1 Tax=Agromyces atrinae TaxID=592376 RepID=A0A4Q2M884_9MICO|nr:lactonase family protein [Agromyces atrinae]NYD67548.1 6-phosphogluconolactonase [Agromyces atrinae]RXZ88238.1 lactonase family protein [Agromyces atrinae]
MGAHSNDILIGSYTERMPHVDGRGYGISHVAFDPATGELGDVKPLAATINPSYLAVNRAGTLVAAALEVGEYDGVAGGAVALYRRDPASGALTLLATQSTGGADACHVAFAADESFVVAANYSGGSIAVFPLDDSVLGARSALVQHAGSGPNSDRQEGPHAHQVVVDPVTGNVLVADLGLDAVFVYAVSAGGAVVERQRLALNPGSGPRHLAFAEDGGEFVVVGELDGTVTRVRRADDAFVVGETVRAAVVGTSQPAAVRFSGDRVLVANRGVDVVSTLGVADDFALIADAPVAGRTPREFIVSADGRFVIVASQDDDLIVSYAYDRETGALAEVSRAVTESPVALVLA